MESCGQPQQKSRMTTLQFLGLQQRSLRCYKKALNNFFTWLEEEEIPLPSKYTKLDLLVARYLEHLWLDDAHLTYAGHTLSAFRRFYPQLRFRLPTAKQYFANWKSSHVCKQAVPMPAEVAMALTGLAIECGEVRFGTALLLGFLAFMRTGEIVNLQMTDIALFVREGQIIVALPSTKTSKKQIDSIAVTDPFVCSLLFEVKRFSPDGSLVQCTPNMFRAKLVRFCQFLELGPCQFTAYSIRRGGASFAFANGEPFDQLLLRGRWQSVKTARIYLDTGRASLVQLSLPQRCERLLDRFSASLRNFCRQLRRRHGH